MRRAAGLAGTAIALAGSLAAQGYRVRLDTRAQSVAYRGVMLDSIPVTDIVTGSGGGPATPDGYAVTCIGSSPYCTYFRPGPEQRAGPVITVADLSVWGIGVRGLSARVTARFGADLGDANVWPGTVPALQLVEGYAEYAVERATARVGRLMTVSRLGMVGFDGASLALRGGRRGLAVDVYGGRGLARGAVLPVTSPVLNPLDDFQPRERQLVVGAGAGWTSRPLDVRADYQREVDPRSGYFVSERLGIEAAVRVLQGWALTGGAEYDLAAGWWGSGDLLLAYSHGILDAAAGARRYRPHFELWTIWGAFSPVPHRALHGRLGVRVSPRLRLHVAAVRYTFDATEVEQPLADAVRDGWRWEWGGTFTPREGLTLDGGYHAQFGPGASARGFGGSVTYAPRPALSVTVHGATLDRPLELRYSAADLTIYGIEAQVRVRERARVALGAARHADARVRPDAGAFEWSHLWLTARVALEFGRGADGMVAPSVIRQLPSGRAAR